MRKTPERPRLLLRYSGVATGWTGVDMSTPLLLEVAPEIHTNPTSFYKGEGVGSVRFLKDMSQMHGVYGICKLRRIRQICCFRCAPRR